MIQYLSFRSFAVLLDVYFNEIPSNLSENSFGDKIGQLAHSLLFLCNT